MQSIILRPEQPADYRETENVTREAFWNCYVPGCDEHYLLHIMRNNPAFVKDLDIVAVCDGKIVGNAVCVKSIIKMDGGNECQVLGLGPISVLPEYQNKGIGGRLIEETRQIARGMGGCAIFLYGDPAYYSRYGFVAAENFDIRTSENMYAEALQVCELYIGALSGITGCYFEGEVYEFDKIAAAAFDKTFPPKEKLHGTASQERFLELVASKRERKAVKERRARIYPVILSEYNPQWPQWYVEEKERLIHLIGGENIVRILHIGSTSVPGLTAKPTVDILLEITEDADLESMIAALPEPEYICLRQQTISTFDRVMFLKGYTDTGFAEKVFHIHVRNSGDWDELYFRDYLVSHPETAAEYAALKRRLLQEYEHDRDGYTAAKGEFIKKYTNKAKKESKNHIVKNIDKIHTTQMGAERIKRNLNNLQTDDIVSWCKDAVKQADHMIRRGKNWYVYKDGMVLTVNAHSYTIITAHRISARVRVMRESDYICLPEFLYQAIYIPEGEEPPPRSIIHDSEIFVYIKNFGTKPDDLGVIAEQNGQIIGAAWTRIIPAYGHLDKDTPELAISILPEFRGYGIGTKLVQKLFEVLRKNGYQQTSLSVQKDNPAVRLYQRLGYEIAGERMDHGGHEDYLMVKIL